MNNDTLHKLTKNMSLEDKAIFKAIRNKHLDSDERRTLGLALRDKKEQCKQQAALIKELRDEIIRLKMGMSNK